VETTGGEAILLALIVAAFLTLLLVLWWRKTMRDSGRGSAGHASQPGRALPAGRGGQLSSESSRAGVVRSRAPRERTQSEPELGELEAQTSRDLVETDNAVRTSEQELGFAVARFGDHAAAQFSLALNSAKEELAAAFQLRQHLDDTAEPARVRQSMLAQIGAHCAEANRLLDEQAEDFDRMQDTETRSPQLLPEVGNHIKQQEARIGGAQGTVGQLADRYTPGAVSIVADVPAQASDRLDAASGAAAAGRLQEAELSADQAESLLDSIGHQEAELTRASSALPAALREIDADIAESSQVVADRPNDRRASAVARAQASAATVRGQMASVNAFDPLAALRELEQASAGLDRTLADARPQEARQEHARGVLDQSMLLARSSLTGTGDFIATRRGSVGVTARTRLAEAQRHYLQGVAVAQSDPETAVAQAQDADTLALEARWVAEQDVQRSGADDVITNRSGFGGATARGRRELVARP
jgi:hypothetical protein